MASEYILITGANGEVGHGLIKGLAKSSNIIALDLNELDSSLKPLVTTTIKGDIVYKELIQKIFSNYKITTIFHLAAVLSTAAEKNPFFAHEVNVCGTTNLFEVATVQKHDVKLIFPSSIATYGLPGLQTKQNAGKVKEGEYLTPITMYGINKLYCEHIGRYYSKHYRSLTVLSKGKLPHYLDFRAVRFPGLISSETLPSGGTSDYAPEMIHAAAKGKSYKCFVRPDTKIPFMAMPDAVDALIKLTNAPKHKLTRRTYNLAAFSVSAKDIASMVKKHFPKAAITYDINVGRQKIVDSWPEDLDDSAARADWNWKPKFNFNDTFEKYLIPAIKARYSKKQ